MPGHFFVVRGDLTQFACDAWLLPTGGSLWIRPQWLVGAPDEFVLRGKDRDGRSGWPRRDRVSRTYHGVISAPIEWRERLLRSFPMPQQDWPIEGDGPRPWLTQIVVDRYSTPAEQAQWCASGAQEFVERAAEALKGKRPANGRARHLLALPVVATGAGGGWDVAGEIVRELVRVLSEVVQSRDIDVALVTHSGDQLAAVQQARRKLAQSEAGLDPWQSLPAHLKAVGHTLAAHSIDGRLVLFLGAGVSVGAGLPAWQALLDQLAVDAELDETDREALKLLPSVDQARIIRDRLERAADQSMKETALADAICKHITARNYSLTHALLANLGVKESVTTNYDRLFEQASEAAGFKTAALPYASVSGADRWLLKLHGCVTQPRDIVLTREDFLRYADRRGALAGIVQALLITRHMLFVGFSLADDNFQRIADEVRKVVQQTPQSDGSATPAKQPFGTALLLSHSHLLPRLWEGDVTCVSMSAGERSAGTATPVVVPLSTAEAAHQLEVLLDFVLFEASQSVAHLLDGRYTEILSGAERSLKKSLEALQAAATPEIRQLPAWRPVAEMLAALGSGGSSQS